MKRIACIALVLASCDAAHTMDAVTREDVTLLDRIDHAICARYLACVPQGGLVDLNTSVFCDPSVWDRHRADVLAGRAHVDVDAARICLADLDALPSCTTHALPDLAADAMATEICNRVRVQDAVTCGDVTCPSDTRCVRDADCRGECVPLGRPGEPCVDDRCTSGSSCSSGTCTATCDVTDCRTSGFEQCSTNGCTRHPRVGEPCDPSFWALACSGAGTACIDGICRHQSILGEPCSTASDCAYGARCDDGRCGQPVVICGGAFCNPGELCDPDTSTCTTDPTRGQCMARWSGWFVLETLDDCPDGYQCGPAARCVRTRMPGETCTGGGDCARGSLCTEGVCVTLAMPWEPCDRSHPCPLQLACVDGACAWSGDRCTGYCRDGACIDGHCRQRAVGDACDGTRECPGCENGICQPFTPLARGTACTAADQCAAGLDCVASNLPAPSRCCDPDPPPP